MKREREREKGVESRNQEVADACFYECPRTAHGRTPLRHTMKEQARGNTKMPSLDTFPTPRSGRERAG